MKKLIPLAALFVMALVSSALGQTINFGVIGGAVFWTTNASGVLAKGTAYAADFYFGPQGSAETELISLKQPATYTTIGSGGVFFGGARTIPGYAGGETIAAQVRIWTTASGSSYEAAIASGVGEAGKSDLFEITLATVPEPPANMTGLNGHNIQLSFIPEPGTVALTVVGLAAVVVFKRRK